MQLSRILKKLKRSPLTLINSNSASFLWLALMKLDECDKENFIIKYRYIFLLSRQLLNFTKDRALRLEWKNISDSIEFHKRTFL